MANKKCPKCGEDNPAEAVMCWACYTPLSGAAPMTAGAAAIPAAAGTAGKIGAPGVEIDETEKKGIDPKAIGVGAVLLIGLAVAGFVTFGMGSGGSDDAGPAPADPTTASAPAPAPAAAPNNPAPAMSGPVGPSVSAPTGQTAVAAVPLPFQAVVQPNPNYATGVAGIMATQQNLSSAQAIGLAKAARQQFMANGRWQNMQVAVFTDQASARSFQNYQSTRKGQKLGPDDYQALASQGVWKGVPAFYESKGRSEYSYYPSQNPNSWWSKSR